MNNNVLFGNIILWMSTTQPDLTLQVVMIFIGIMYSIFGLIELIKES